MLPVELWPSARTETWVQAPARVFEDHGPVGAIRTRSNPSYRWGNCLVLPEAPAPEALPLLEALHGAIFPDLPVACPALYWPGGAPAGPLAMALAARRYAVEVEAPLRASLNGQPPPRLPAGVSVDPARSPAEWAEMVAFRLALHPELPANFMLHRLASAWETAQAVEGDWWLLRKDGEAIGSMGLFWRGGIARYQDVDVRADHHGRGLGRLMFHTVRAHGEASDAFDQQVIVADRGSLAHAWYQRMGFAPLGGEVFVYREASTAAAKRSAAPSE